MTGQLYRHAITCELELRGQSQLRRQREGVRYCLDTERLSNGKSSRQRRVQMDLVISICCRWAVSVPVQPFEALPRIIPLGNLFEFFAVRFEPLRAIGESADRLLIHYEWPDEKLFWNPLWLDRHRAKRRCRRPLKAGLGPRKSGISRPRKPVPLSLSNNS